MAIPNAKAALFFKLLFLLSFLLIFFMAESTILGIGIAAKSAPPECDTVYGAQSGDTCFAVTQMFNLTAESFSAINPNLECDNIFVGQWLCVEGSAN